MATLSILLWPVGLLGDECESLHLSYDCISWVSEVTSLQHTHAFQVPNFFFVFTLTVHLNLESITKCKNISPKAAVATARTIRVFANMMIQVTGVLRYPLYILVVNQDNLTHECFMTASVTSFFFNKQTNIAYFW